MMQNDATFRPADVPALQRPLAQRLQLVLGALAALFLTAGLGLGAFLAVDSVNYRYWPPDADFRGDGTAHEVTVEPGKTFFLWKYASFDTPRCSVRELPSGEEVVLDALTGGEWQRGGGAVPHVAFAEGRADSTRVSVTCAATAPSRYDGNPSPVYHLDQPHGPAFADSLGPWWPAPVALIATGLALIAGTVAAALRARRRARGAA